jgi:ABC-type transport system substrate-binding protein
MKPKEIFAFALLAIMVASLFTFAPTPVVAAADDSLFEITIIAPAANTLRRQWGLIIANSFQSVGIEAKVVFLTWGSVYDRALTPEASMIGKTWTEGGFDSLLIGWTPGSPSTPFLGTMQIYYSKNTPPNSNFYLWNNSESDAYIMNFLTSGYTAEGIEAFKNWQYMQYIDVPASQIAFQQAVLTADSDLNFHGYQWIFDNIGPIPQYLTGMDDVVLATTGELLALNPMLSNSWYDTLVFNPVFDNLFWLDENFTYQYHLCTNLEISEDFSTYTYTLRPGVLFHDGIEFSADDVLFSFLAYMNPTTGSQQSGIEVGYIGDDVTFTWENGTTTRLVVDLAESTGYYPATTQTGTRQATMTALDKYTVEITIADFEGMTQPVATFHPEADGIYILPMHVLESIPFTEWATHPFNLGTGSYESNGQTFSGPIGTGAYVYKSYSAVNALATLQKNDDYFNKATLESQGLFVVENYYVRYIEGKDAAIAALSNNEVQILDQNYAQAADYLAGNLDFATNYILVASGIQQLGYNMQHPVFGTGVATPLGQSDPSRAAEAAQYVRQAMDYLIPRDIIIDNLLAGLADPAAVHVNPLSPYFNSSIVAREYNPTKARELLAMAGYDTGVTPSEGGSTETVVGKVIGMYVVLESSADGLTWTPAQVSTTDPQGNYYFTHTPTAAGTQYHVVMTGIQVQTAIDNDLTANDMLSYWTIPLELQSLPVAMSGISTSESTSAMAFSGKFDISPYDGLNTYGAYATNNDLNALNAKVTQLNSTVATQQTTINTLQTQLNSLSASLGSVSTIAYAGVGVGIIALLVAAFALMRKK